jgi:glycerophosphoryl diester phosphodiesterase
MLAARQQLEWPLSSFATIRPRIYAHRGASAEQPENTMPAFQLALELGADALELDIHRTKDGALVVAHDPDGRRMCGVAVAIADATLAEVREWDPSHGFTAKDGSRPYLGHGIRIPTFEEVIVEFQGVPLNVDLKHELADDTVALLRRLGAEERVLLASFQAATLRRVRALGYRGPTGLGRAEVLCALALPRIFQRGPLAVGGSRAQLPLSLLGAPVVRRLHALGLSVDYWTIDDPALAKRAAALGADGIMTNDPRAIVPLFSEPAALRR